MLSRAMRDGSAHPDELFSVTEVNQYRSVIYAHSDTDSWQGQQSDTFPLWRNAANFGFFHCEDPLFFGKDTYMYLPF